MTARMRSKRDKPFTTSKRPHAVPPLSIGKIAVQPTSPDIPTTQASNIDSRVITHM